MSEDFYGKLDRIARSYLSARQKLGTVNDTNLRGTQDTINRLEEAKQKLSETSLLRSRLQVQINELKKQTEESGELGKGFDGSRRELLELIATSFEIDPCGEKTLSEDSIRAITDVLFKKERPQFEFHSCLVKPNKTEICGDNTQALLTCANASDFVQEAARKILGRGTLLDELWNRITNAEAMFKVYSVLATNDKVLTAAEIAPLVGEEGWDRVRVKNTLENLMRDSLFTHKLIRRVEEGKYQISDVGRFLWLEFGPLDKKEGKEEPQTVTSSAPSQSMLNNWNKS